MSTSKSLFQDIVDKNSTSDVRIYAVSENLINRVGFTGGYALPSIINEKLVLVEVLVAMNFSEDEKIKRLFHELGHVKDYKNRERTLVEANKKGLDAEIIKFNEESEYVAFEHSLEEALILHNKGHKGVLKSLLDNIPKRKNDVGYENAVSKILKSDLWTKCENAK